MKRAKKNLWPFDSFVRTTVKHVKTGRTRTTKTRYRGFTIWRQGDGFVVPELDTSIFESVAQAKRFIRAERKDRGMKNPKLTGRWLKVDKVKVNPNGTLSVIMRDKDMPRALRNIRNTPTKKRKPNMKRKSNTKRKAKKKK